MIVVHTKNTIQVSTVGLNFYIQDTDNGTRVCSVKMDGADDYANYVSVQDIYDLIRALKFVHAVATSDRSLEDDKIQTIKL